MLKEKLLELLFKTDDNVYAILDGALNEELFFTLTVMLNELPYLSLYTGEDKENLEEVAPYLVELDKESELTDWILKNYDEKWGFFIQSPHDLNTIYEELYQRVKIKDETTNNNLFIRFYDPRATEKYMKLQTQEELQELFEVAPVIFYANSENKEFINKIIYKNEHINIQSINIHEVKYEIF
ncbi:MAG: DUF4123 domain-containing protein [bacterium]